MSSAITIGVISSEYEKEGIKRALKMFPNFRPLYRSIESLDEVEQCSVQLSAEANVLLFGDYFSYKTAMESVPIPVPVHYIPLKESALYRAFYRLKNRVPNMKAMSMDTLQSRDAEGIVTDLGFEHPVYFYKDGASLASVEALISFHMQLFQKKRNYCCIDREPCRRKRINETTYTERTAHTGAARYNCDVRTCVIVD